MYKIYVPKDSIACLKLCMHRTIFWGGGIHVWNHLQYKVCEYEMIIFRQ
jgi:hypothetical protein